MHVTLTPDQQAFIRQAITAGRFRSEDEAVAEALKLWEGCERARAELLSDVDAGGQAAAEHTAPPVNTG